MKNQTTRLGQEKNPFIGEACILSDMLLPCSQGASVSCAGRARGPLRLPSRQKPKIFVQS